MREALCCDALGSCGIPRALSGGGRAPQPLLPHWGPWHPVLWFPFQALFPARRSYQVDRYHYFCTTAIFSGHEVYAEWTLPADALAAETARVTALFEGQGTCSRFMQGDFMCYVCSRSGRVDSLTEVTGHELMAFACNEQTGQVRYIACYGGYGRYYTQQDWGTEGADVQ